MTNHGYTLLSIGDTCPVDGREVRKEGAPACGWCWQTITNMCRGKRRVAEHAARQVEQKVNNRDAYLCPCCDSWHTGGTLQDGGAVERRELAAAVRAYLEATRGVDWWREHIILNWDPELNSTYTRSR